MKTQSRLFVAVMALTVGMLALPMAVAGDDTKQDAPKTIDELLQQRRDTLQKVVHVLTEEYRQGSIGFDSVVSASDKLIDAELELVESRQERIELMKKRVELMKSLLARSESLFFAGQASQADFLSARASLLDAKIQLARKRAGGGGEASK